MTAKERLIKFIEFKGSNNNKFEKSVGLSTGFVNNIGDSIRLKSLNKIKATYPDLNTSWLLTGEGKMLTEYTEPEPETNDEAVQAATIKMLVHEMAKLKAKVFSLSYDDCLTELEQNTTLILRDLLKGK